VGNSPHPDILHVGIAPVVNLKAEPAQPLSVDGTRSEFPLLGLSAGRDFRLQSVTGVYQLVPTGREPLRPAYLPGEGPSYEIDEELGADLSPQHRLLLRMPEAFDAPRKVLVEALWYQPKFAAQAVGRLDVSTPSRHVEGLRWRMVGNLQPHRHSPLRDDVAALTQLLSWKVKPTLERDELLALLSYLGTPVEGPFRPIIPWIRKTKASIVPDGALRGTGLRHVYEMLLEPLDSGTEPLMVCLLEQVQELLDAWNGEATVDLKPTVAGAGPLSLRVSP
jgi:type VI secretion system protein ImpG